ncbi:MAG TPA: DoxX family protein [Gemmatimonadales bacterium]|nr:DoxX family protein [Gemmatimonadales bacterium]
MIGFSSFERAAQRLTPLAATALRIALGWIFLRHGLMKIHMGVGGVTGFLAGLGFPVARAWAVVLIVLETFGAACVVAGLLTRFWAACFAVEMVVAITRAILPTGRAFELEGLLFAGALALVFLGDGWLALGQLIGGRKAD